MRCKASAHFPSKKSSTGDAQNGIGKEHVQQTSQLSPCAEVLCCAQHQCMQHYSAQVGIKYTGIRYWHTELANPTHRCWAHSSPGYHEAHALTDTSTLQVHKTLTPPLPLLPYFLGSAHSKGRTMRRARTTDSISTWCALQGCLTCSWPGP
eukprot:scaffold203291_cov21-Tisochrysis_lutea.AAC.1